MLWTEILLFLLPSAKERSTRRRKTQGLTGVIGFAVLPTLQDVPFFTETLVTALPIFTLLVTSSPYLAVIKICHVGRKAFIIMFIGISWGLPERNNECYILVRRSIQRKNNRKEKPKTCIFTREKSKTHYRSLYPHTHITISLLMLINIGLQDSCILPKCFPWKTCIFQ